MQHSVCTICIISYAQSASTFAQYASELLHNMHQTFAQYASSCVINAFTQYAMHLCVQAICICVCTQYAHISNLQLCIMFVHVCLCTQYASVHVFLCNTYLNIQRSHYSTRHSKSYCLPECPMLMIPSSADGPSCPVQPLVTT